MKLYVFYMIRNVKKELIDTPIMYAITDDSDYAKAFERTRNMKYFYKKEIECSRKEAMKEMDRARAPILTLTTLKTQKSNMITKVSLVCTWEEESRVLLDAPSIYFNHVSKNMINPNVFSDKVKMYLDDIDYLNTWRYQESKNDPILTEEFMFSSDNYIISRNIDELMIFLKSYGWMMKIDE